MKPELSDLVSRAATADAARSLLREYVQARVLESLQHSGAMVTLAFQGGTALRYLFSLPRFSEDLDFSLERAPETYDLRAWLRRLESTFHAEGYNVELKVNDGKTVHVAWVRFPGLLHEMELSPHPAQVTTVKIVVDTRPPAGVGLATTVVRRHRILQLHHHDRASLLAGKLHAVLQRPYAKGRDIYDLLWYLSDHSWPEPNFTLLRNALAQTGWRGATPTPPIWRQILIAHLHQLEWGRIAQDVAPFLERPSDLALLTRDHIVSLLGQSSGEESEVDRP